MSESHEEWMAREDEKARAQDLRFIAVERAGLGRPGNYRQVMYEVHDAISGKIPLEALTLEGARVRAAASLNHVDSMKMRDEIKNLEEFMLDPFKGTSAKKALEIAVSKDMGQPVDAKEVQARTNAELAALVNGLEQAKKEFRDRRLREG